MRFVGYFFLLLFSVIILLLFIRIKIELFFNHQDAWVEFKYLCFKYRLDLKESDRLRQDEPGKSSEEDITLKTQPLSQQRVKDLKVEDSHHRVASMKEKEKASTQSLKSKDDTKKKTSPTRENKKQRFVKKKASSKNSATDTPPSPPKRRPSIRSMIRIGKTLLKDIKTIVVRFTTRIKVHKLESCIDFSLEDAMITGCLIGTFWSMEAWIYRFIQSYVKKIESYHFDVKSNFEGNSFFIKLSCILSFRMVDIIVVIILSIKELLRIKKLVKFEEEA